MFGQNQQQWRPSHAPYQGGGRPPPQGGWPPQQYGGPPGPQPMQQQPPMQQPMRPSPMEPPQGYQQMYPNAAPPAQRWGGPPLDAPGPQQGWAPPSGWQQSPVPANRGGYGRPAENFGSGYQQQAPWQQPQREPAWNQPSQHPPPTAGPSPRPPFGGPGSQTPDLRAWVGKVTQLIPPNYGIIDGNSFYVTPVVVGREPQLGEVVRAEAVPNTDGGMYQWRCMRVEAMEPGGRPPAAQPRASASQQPPPPLPPSQPQASVAQPPSSEAFKGPAGRQGARAQSALAPAVSRGPTAAAAEQPASGKYNQMAPPTNQYTADIAMAVAQNAVEGRKVAPPQGPEPAGSRRVFPSALQKQLDQEAKKRSESALQSLTTYADTRGVGLKLLASMGFGGEGTGLGRNEQGIAAPVEAKEMLQGAGLGFERRRSPQKDRLAGHNRPPARRRSPPPRRRSRSRDRDTRYVCSPPKFPAFELARGIPQLSKRYKNLYIPADFCRMNACWVHSLPDHRPLDLTDDIGFKISKMENEEIGALPKPAELDGDVPVEVISGRYWSAKVVLMTGVQKEGFYQAGARGWQNPRQRLQFLVGRRGKNEVMPIGGRWEPCDGPHPEADPSSLKATAIRTFRAATGLDLTACAEWYTFADFSYLRQADKKRDALEHMEKTVLFLVGAAPLATPDLESAEALGKAKVAAAEEEAARKALEAAEAAAKEAEKVASEVGAKDPPTEASDADSLEAASLTVAQLQEELTKRGLDTKWNPLKGKKELVDRLQEWLSSATKVRKEAQQEYDAAQAAKVAAEAAVQTEKDAREAYQAAKSATKGAAKLLDNPPPLETVEVKVNREFLGKKEKFAALGISLDGLLEYTEDDTREPTFEASMFGELFQDMLDTRFGRGLLRSFAVLEKQMEEAQAEKAAEQAVARLAALQADSEAGQGGGELVATAEQRADSPQAMEMDAGQAAQAEPGEKQKTGVAADDVSGTRAEEPAVEASLAPAATIAADGAVAAPPDLEHPTANGVDDEEMPAAPLAAQEPAAKVTPQQGKPEARGLGDDTAASEQPQAPAEPEKQGSKKKTLAQKAAQKKEEAAQKKREEAARKKKEEATPKGSKAERQPDKKTPSQSARSSKKASDKEAEEAGSSKDRVSKKPSSKEEKKRVSTSKDEDGSKASKAGKPKEKSASEQRGHKDRQAEEPRGSRTEAARGTRADTAAEERREGDRRGIEEKRSNPGDGPGAAPPSLPADSQARPAQPAEEGRSQPQPAAEAIQADTQPAAHRKRAGDQLNAGAVQKRQKTDAEWALAAPGEAESLSVACRWFDRECAGYLEGDDLEEIIFMVSDAISRKRVQTLVDSVIRSGRFSYGDYASFHLPAAAPPLDEPAGAGGVSRAHSAAAGELHKRLAVLEDEHKAAEATAAKLTTEMGSTRKECDQLAARNAELEALVARLEPQVTDAAELKQACSTDVQLAATELSATAKSLQGVQSHLNALADSLGVQLA